MSGTTTIHALPYPTGADLVKDGDDAIKALADSVDPKLTPPSSGTLASRPTSSAGSPGKLGRLYFASDIKVLYFDYGTGWIELGSKETLLMATVLTGTVVANAWTTITAWNAVSASDAGMLSGGVFTAPREGVYAVNGQISFTVGGVSSKRGVRVIDSVLGTGGGFEDAAVLPATASGVLQCVPFSKIVELNQGSTVRIDAFQDSTDGAASLAGSFVNIARIGTTVA